MYNVARLSDKDRDAIFTRYAFEYGNNKAIIEKDFWLFKFLYIIDYFTF
jgi:hypothetical protein